MNELVCISIAVDKFDDHKIKNLNNCISDANGIIRVLKEKYRVKRVIELYNELASKKSIEKAFTSLYLNYETSVDILVLLNGHGFAFDDLYYFPLKSSDTSLTSSCFSGKELASNLKLLNKYTNVAVIVNTCDSGYLFDLEYFSSQRGGVFGFSRLLFVSSAKSQNVQDSSNVSGFSIFGSEIISYLRNNSTVSELSFMSVIGHTKYDLAKVKKVSLPREGFFQGHNGGDFVFNLINSEAADWENTLQVNSVEAYSDYLSRHAGINEVNTRESVKKLDFFKNEIDDLSSIIEKVEKVIESYKRYEIEGEFSTGMKDLKFHIKKINDAVNGGKSAENEWQKIRLSSDKENFKKFTENYPESSFVPIAQRILNKIIEEEKDDFTWSEVVSNRNTSTLSRIGRLKVYIEKFEYGRHSKNAFELINDMEAFYEIESENDSEVQLKLLNEYINNPNFSEYNHRAKKMVDDIELSHRFNIISDQLDNYVENNDYDEIVGLIDFFDGTTEIESQKFKSLKSRSQSFINDYLLMIESEANDAIESASPMIMFNFIEKFPNTEWTKSVQKEFDKVDIELWEQVDYDTTTDILEEFIDKFKGTNSSFLEKAEENLIELTKYNHCQSVDDLNDYIDRYQERGLKYDEAIQRINQIEREEKTKEDFARALEHDSVEVYESFLHEYGFDIEYSDEIVHRLGKAKARSFRNDLISEIENASGDRIITLLNDNLSNIDEVYIEELKEILEKANREKLFTQEFNQALADRDEHKIESDFSELEEFKYFDALPVLDSLDYLKTLSTNDLQIISIFIEENESNKFIEDLIVDRDAIITREEDALEKYKEFLLKYPDCIYKDEFTEQIEKLTSEEQDREAFLEAFQNNNETGFINYLNREGYRNEENVKTAKQELVRINQQKAEDKIFEDLKTNPVKEICLKYLNDYKVKGRYIKEVENILGELISPKTENNDLETTAKVSNVNFWKIGFVISTLILIFLIIFLIVK